MKLRTTILQTCKNINLIGTNASVLRPLTGVETLLVFSPIKFIFFIKFIFLQVFRVQVVLFLFTLFERDNVVQKYVHIY